MSSWNNGRKFACILVVASYSGCTKLYRPRFTRTLYKHMRIGYVLD